MESPVILTIGHSTHSIEEFIGLLQTHAVTRVVDVRTVPRSRRYPQFNRGALAYVLNSAAISYTHLSGLGGMRQPRPDSANTGWREAPFRGFADYMQTSDFVDNLQTLLELAQVDRIAVMCAEAVPWRCHRTLIADALVVRGLKVEHILGAKRTYAHILTPFAKINGTGLTYPPAAEAPAETSSE